MTKIELNREWAPFERDIALHDGYVYTTNPSSSARIASRRHSDAIHDALDFRGRRVIDIGCGDGTYSVELYDRGRPASIAALDPAAKAVETARRKAGARNIIFEVGSAYEIPRDDNSFEIAHLRGVLHHMDRPFDAIREALRVAPTIILLEPNGFNLGLKLIEKLSRYHRDHGEKSYPPSRLDRWARQAGGNVVYRSFVCLVPFFSPDWLAHALKRVEPLIESVPGVNQLACGAYVMVATKNVESPESNLRS